MNQVGSLSMIKTILLAAVSLFFLFGCSPTRHLDITAQERTTKQIIFGKFELDGLYSGEARGDINGENFKGTWSANIKGAQATSNNSGVAYGYVAGTPVSRQYYDQTRTNVTSKNADVSLMVVGNKGTNISCQFIARASLVLNQGMGVCEDNRGLFYDFHY